MTVYWIDNEQDIRDVIKDLFEGITVLCHWDEINPVEGDLVIHDSMGVGEKKIVRGVVYIKCSGTLEIEEGELAIPKPFDPDKAAKYINDQLILMRSKDRVTSTF